MRYRVMASDGTIEDFEKESDARILFDQKKIMVSKAKIEIKNGIEMIPSAKLHKCYHDETPVKSCEMIERYVRKVTLERSVA